MILRAGLRGFDWRSTTFEIALIFVAVLAALGTDAWWEYRQDRQKEADYLQALRTDFETNRDRLARLAERATGAIAIGNALHRSLAGEIAPGEVSQLREQLLEFYVIDLFEPITGTYDEMVASGRLLLLRDAGLRTALARFHRRLDTVRQAEQLLLDSWQEAQLPFLRMHAVLTSLRPEAHPVPTPYTDDIEALQSRVYWNLVAEWTFAKRDLASIYRSVQEESVALISRIDGQGRR